MKINQPTPSQLETLYPERSYIDMQKMYTWANQSYYQLSADKKMYSTVFFKINPFNGNKIQPMISNFIEKTYDFEFKESKKDISCNIDRELKEKVMSSYDGLNDLDLM